MDTNLNENQKKQLDEIVHKMTVNGEKPSAIQFVVNDFKSKYAPPPVPEQPKEGFLSSIGTGLKNIGKDILGIEQNKSTGLIPSLVQSTIGSKGLAGIAQLPGRVIDVALHPEEKPNITAGQAVGTTVNAGLTALTGGTGSVASKVGLKGATGLGARIAENAALGGGFQAGSNLVDQKPIGENVGLSSIIGGALPIAGVGFQKVKGAIQNQAISESERVINSLIKPLSKDFAYGKNPARGILNEGITANSLEDLGHKVASQTNLVGEGIGAIGQKLDQSGVTLNLTPALSPIEKAIQEAAKSNNTTLFNSLQNVKTALLHDLTAGIDEKGLPSIVKGAEKNLIGANYGDAKTFLSDISSHTRFTGNPSDDKALNKATKQAYGVAREIMNKAADGVDPELGKQIRNLNERYADLLSAQNAINHRDIVEKRQNFLNLADRFSIPVSVASSLATGLITGDFGKAGLLLAAQLGTIAGTKAMGSAYAKTRIAQFISRLAPVEREGILNSTPVLKNFYERVTGKTSPTKENVSTTRGASEVAPILGVAGATGLGAVGTKAVSDANPPETYKKEASIVSKKSINPEVEKAKKEAAFRESGVVKGDKYNYEKKNLNGSVDLGKYQVNEKTLASESKRFLGRVVSPEEFKKSPELQEKFFEKAYDHLKSLGVKKLDTFLALWHGGWGDISTKRILELKKSPEIVKYLNNKPKD